MIWKDELKAAIHDGNIEKLKTFKVSQLTTVLSRAHFGQRALGYACSLDGNINSIRQIIIQLGEKAQSEACYVDHARRTPLHEACLWHGMEAIVLVLRALKDKARKMANKKDCNGSTPRDIFAKSPIYQIKNSGDFTLDKLIEEIEAEECDLPSPVITENVVKEKLDADKSKAATWYKEDVSDEKVELARNNSDDHAENETRETYNSSECNKIHLG